MWSILEKFAGWRWDRCLKAVDRWERVHRWFRHKAQRKRFNFY